MGIYNKQNPEVRDSQIPLPVKDSDIEPVPVPVPDPVDDETGKPTEGGGSATGVIIVLLIIFALIGLFMYFYGKKCIEKLQNRENMNAVFGANKTPNVEERENMIKRAQE